MKKIIPHLWFDTEAKEAVNFYVSVFPDASITQTSTIHNVPTPTGDCDIISFALAGQPFMAINAGPLFTFNPSISFILNFDPSRDEGARAKLDALWGKLSEGGRALMPIDRYPFSERYGWIQDRYGLSWQLILSNPGGEARPFVVPALMFIGRNDGKAKEAIDFYCSVFSSEGGSASGRESRMGQMVLYPSGHPYGPAGNVMFADFRILDTWLAAMDSGHLHDFNFNEAISLLIPCEDQREIDYYWGKLSADPKAEQCGWLKDKYGVSWQVWPIQMGEMMQKGTQEQIDRVTQAFLPMKKFDISTLEKAYKGK